MAKKMSKEKNQNQNQKIEPKIIWKNQMEKRHDVFKSDVRDFLKNTSFKAGQISIEKVQHSHIFHTIDSRGKELQLTDTVGGHFHEVKVEVDENGYLKAVCGPAMVRENIKTRSGLAKIKISPLRFHDEYNDKDIVDDHSHEFTYLRSEMINVGNRSTPANATAFLQQMKQMNATSYTDPNDKDVSMKVL